MGSGCSAACSSGAARRVATRRHVLGHVVVVDDHRRRRLDVGRPDHELGRVGLRRQQRLERLGAAPSIGAERATRAFAASVAGRRATVVAIPEVERRSARVVPATPAPVARRIPASVAPVTRISPAANRNTARMSAPAVEIRCEVTHSSACPTTPPRVSNARRPARTDPPAPRPGPTPSVPAASASVIEHVRQMTPVRSGRPGGRISRASTSPPRDHERGRNDVSERAEHEPQRR